MYSKETFSIAIFLPRDLMYHKASNFTSGGVQNRETKNRTLGMILTSFQDFKLRGKQISQSFSYCELINSLRNSAWFKKKKKNKALSVFLEALSP